MTNLNIKTIDVHMLKSKMEQNSDLCVIDVREEEEWQMGHIPKTFHISKGSITTHIEVQIPDKNHSIYLLCQGGVRSLHAAHSLMNLGYQEVYSVEGGIMAWSAFGYPVE
ncbi:rhodanese-like domain-containing protein [Legionella sp.]|uniref:rhodanese-like domain-containing protein n=1 Tax=Legionella sp. TaxID=459 RepID=UPI003CB5024C